MLKSPKSRSQIRLPNDNRTRIVSAEQPAVHLRSVNCPHRVFSFDLSAIVFVSVDRVNLEVCRVRTYLQFFMTALKSPRSPTESWETRRAVVTWFEVSPSTWWIVWKINKCWIKHKTNTANEKNSRQLSQADDPSLVRPHRCTEARGINPQRFYTNDMTDGREYLLGSAFNWQFTDRQFYAVSVLH